MSTSSTSTGSSRRIIWMVDRFACVPGIVVFVATFGKVPWWAAVLILVGAVALAVVISIVVRLALGARPRWVGLRRLS